MGWGGKGCLLYRELACYHDFTVTQFVLEFVLLQCNGGVSDAVGRNLERELTSGLEEVGVISGSCRIVTETLANITSQNNIAHVRAIHGCT